MPTIHPIWSLDRNEWVPLGELLAGDQLSSQSGPAVVLSIAILNRPTTVYNIEVHAEHVYEVGELNLLVHNSTDDCVRTGFGAFGWGRAPIGGVATTFGHGVLHLEGTGLVQGVVEGAITRQIQSQAAQGAKFGQGFWGRITIGGRTVEYRAFTLPDGTINIGTYYPL